MSSDLTFSVADVAGFDRRGRRHAGRRKRLADLFGKLPAMRAQALLEEVGAEVENQTRRRVSEEKRAPDGEAWDEWSDAYAATRPPKGGLLELEGHLIDSITYNVNTDTVSVGSNLVYAGVHQYGHGGVPARPYLGQSAENTRELTELVLDWIEKEMGK